jgi:hypothetical protein
VFALFPGANRLSLLSIRLLEGAQVAIDGFGLPFANAGNPDVEGWVNDNTPMAGGTTLLELVQRREFHPVVSESCVELRKKWSEDHLSPPFSYPYGIAQPWDLKEDFKLYEALVGKNKGTVGFRAAYRYVHRLYTSATWVLTWNVSSFDNDNAHLTVRIQSVVQDVIWFQQAVVAISQLQFPVYFVNRGTGDRQYYVVIPVTTVFRERFEAAWSTLAKDGDVGLLLHVGEDKKPIKW